MEPITSQSLSQAFTQLSATFPPTSSISLSAKEAHLLSLISQDQDLKLTIALLNAYASTPRPSTTPSQTELAEAEAALQTSLARYTLRNKITQRTLTAGPFATATHAPTEIDQRLVWAMHARDALNMLAGVATTAVADLRREVAEMERLATNALRDNERMAERMIGMAEQVRQQEHIGEGVSEGLKQKVEEVERDVRRARREWRVVRGLVGGVIVGSGVDWAADERLVDMVIDDDGEI